MVGVVKEQIPKLEKIAFGLSGSLTFISGVTLVAWAFGWRSILAPLNGLLPINPLTSIEFLLISAAIMFARKQSPAFFNTLLFCLLLCNITVVLGKMFEFPSYIDTFFFHRQMAEYQGSQVLNGMSMTTAICFILTITSLALLSSDRVSQYFRESLNIIVFFVSLTVMLSYLFRVPEALPFFLMAPLAAILFLILSVVILLLKPQHGFIRHLVIGPFSQSPERILIPLSLIFPIALGYVRLFGEWYHLISTELGVTFIILTVVIVLAGSAWALARSFNQKMNLFVDYQQQASALATANEELQALAEELQTANEELGANLEALSHANVALEKANATIARQKDEQLNRVLNSTNDVVWSFDLTGKGENYLSHSAERVYRKPYETLLAKPYFWLEPVLPADQRMKQASQARLNETGETSCTYRILIDGEVRWVKDDLKLIKDENGIPIRLEGVASDITEIIEKEAEVLHERNLLRALIDNIPSYIFLRDTNLKTILSNRATYKLLGATREDQVIGRDLIDYYGEQARSLFEEEKKVLATGEPLINREVKVNVHGREALLSSTKVPIKDETGKVIQILGISHDITDLRRQENELKQYRQDLEIVFTNSADNFVVIDREGRIVLLNEGFKRFSEEMRGVAPEVGAIIFDVLPPDRVEPSREVFRRVLQGEKVDLVAKTILNEVPRYFSVRYSPVIHEGEVKFISISAFDVTEKKNQEIKLAESQAELEIIFKNSSDYFQLMDTSARLILFNQNFAKLIEEFYGKVPKVGAVLWDLMSPERVEVHKKLFDRAKQGESFYFESRVQTPNGERHFEVRYGAVKSNDQVTHVSISSMDITERKNHEIKLAEYRQELEMIFNNSSDIFFLVDKKEKLTLFNKRFSDYCNLIMGVTPKPGLAWHATVSPEHIQKYQEYADRAFRGESFTYMDKLETGAGALYLHTRVQPLFSEGKVTHMMVSIADRTAELKREEEAEKYRENLEIIFQNSTDHFALLNTNGEIVVLNHRLQDFIRKYSKIEPTPGLSFYDVVAPNRREAARLLVQRALAGERVKVVSESVFESETRYYDVIYNPVIKNGKVTHVTITSTDITDARRQERLTRQYQDTLDIVFKTSRDTFVLISADGKVVSFNDAFEKFIKDVANIQPRVGNDFLDIVAPHRQADAIALFKKTLAGERSAIDAEFKSSAGQKIFHYVRYEPIINEGRVTHACITAVDVTAFRNIENELKRDQYFLDKASESARIGYWTSEPGYTNGKLTWSKEVFKIFDVAEEGFSGKNTEFFDRVYAEDRPRVMELSKAALETDSVYDIDHRIVLADGTVRWVSEKAQVIRDNNNKATLVGVIQDINDRKVIERVLREYNERFEVLSKATNDAIWDLDIEKDVETWNHGLETIFGYEQREVKEAQRWWSEKIHPDDYPRVTSEMNAVITHHQSNWITEYRYRCANGDYKNVLDRAYVVYSGHKAIRMIGAMQDITEVVQYRQNLEAIIEERTHKLNDSVRKEKELVNLKSKFISIASHEFRTPLATIALSSNFLKRFSEKLQPQQIVEKAGAIEKQVQHMTALVEDVLFVGKSEEGKVKVDKKITPVTIFEKLVREALSSRNDTHALKLITQVKVKEFETDEKLLRNIVFNLVSNAVKFSPKAKNIYISLREEGKKLHLSVRDEGIGIPSEELKNLFASFTRASNAHSIEGTGLGLVIIKRAVELLNGSIDVRSEVGKGTEFIVLLPL
ncbi:MAG TPA: PAS domain S-box protein [Cyclobacteriaceae bacterium]|nr:PAS domain S-box protein [Cyclobacteriaceae bacterium]